MISWLLPVELLVPLYLFFKSEIQPETEMSEYSKGQWWELTQE